MLSSGKRDVMGKKIASVNLVAYRGGVFIVNPKG
jgi:hypothetical protein